MQTRASWASKSRRRQEAHVVGGDHGHRVPLGKRQCRRDRGLLVGTADARQLEVVAVGAEQLEPVSQQPLRVAGTPGREAAADVAGGAAAQRDQTAGGLARHPRALDLGRAALLAFEVGAGHEPRQVAVAGVVHAQQGQPRRHAAFPRLRDQQVDADDGLDALLQRLAIELHHREQVVFVGEGDRRHGGGGGGAHQPGTRMTLSTSENSVCTRRCTKGVMDRVRPSSGTSRGRLYRREAAAGGSGVAPNRRRARTCAAVG
jgi:hypothetical protein